MNHQGTGHLPGPVRWRCKTVQLARVHRRMAAGICYKGVQIPSWDARVFDLKNAATSKTYCDEVKGTLRSTVWRSPSCRPTAGQLVAVHPAYYAGFDACRARGCAATRRRGRSGLSTDDAGRQGVEHLGLTAHANLLRALPGLTCTRGRRGRPPDRNRIRRTGQTLAADPRRVRP